MFKIAEDLAVSVFRVKYVVPGSGNRCKGTCFVTVCIFSSWPETKVLHPYKTTSKITLLYILIFRKNVTTYKSKNFAYYWCL